MANVSPFFKVIEVSFNFSNIWGSCGSLLPKSNELRKKNFNASYRDIMLEIKILQYLPSKVHDISGVTFHPETTLPKPWVWTRKAKGWTIKFVSNWHAASE